MHRVVALALPSVVMFDLAIPAEVFGGDGYSFAVCAETPGHVPTTNGFDVRITRGLDALDTADTVVVPGYAPPEEPSARVLDALRAASARGARVVSICTGAFALAAAGLLDGRAATTHWVDAPALAARYPAVDVDPDVLYADGGRTLTSAGFAAGIDLCLHLVRADHGAEAAVRVARRLVVAPHREGGQSQFLERPLPPGGEGLAAVCEWALRHLAEPLTVAGLARQAGWSARTFARRFTAETGMTPHRWLAAQRVLEARRLLEQTDLPVDEVARRSGLGTAANLRTHLHRDAATTPTAYRRAYRGRTRQDHRGDEPRPQAHDAA
ncbi:helix-turn-helix domain-containing protein [Nonomuraea sp. CA-218870]|uniref:Helix-turn-helix domain-containing protein n=1 Tax=Nonomuraea corallina TaxID=2989783 RepID=A0ABT4SBK4_9ACTN|nr:helix-turn-helix domain-containing protein [Nonomuraea corallina]MDA0634564.1 helix-turn-helix domain-containing protein [Nonomuraea corallina]